MQTIDRTYDKDNNWHTKHAYFNAKSGFLPHMFMVFNVFSYIMFAYLHIPSLKNLTKAS